MDLRRICQLNWALTFLRPKHCSKRTLDMFLAQCLEAAEAGIHDPELFMFIMQGSRNRRSSDLYLKMRRNLITNKEKLFGGERGEAWAATLNNVFHSFASNRPTNFGKHKLVAAEDIDELLQHYEWDLCDAAPLLDADGICRLAETLQLLRSRAHVNIWWRVENRISELAVVHKQEYDQFQLAEIFRAFTRGQQN